MIEINGVLLRNAKESPYMEIEQKMNDTWKRLVDRYGLDKKGTIRLKLKKKFLVEKQISSENGESFTKSIAYPMSIGVRLRTDFYFEGSPFEARYYTSKKSRKNDDNFDYYPANYDVRSDVFLGYNDRDLILYLYMFSNIVEDFPEDNTFDFTKKEAKFYFYDELEASTKVNDTRIKLAKATLFVEEVNKAVLKNFAVSIGMKPEKDAIMKSKVLKSIEDSIKYKDGTYEKLIRYATSFDEVSSEIETFVRDGYKEGFIRTKVLNLKNAKKVSWYYTAIDEKFHEQDGAEPMVDSVIAMLNSDADKYLIYKERYLEFKNKK